MIVETCAIRRLNGRKFIQIPQLLRKMSPCSAACTARTGSMETHTQTQLPSPHLAALAGHRKTGSNKNPANIQFFLVVFHSIG